MPHPSPSLHNRIERLRRQIAHIAASDRRAWRAAAARLHSLSASAPADPQLAALFDQAAARLTPARGTPPPDEVARDAALRSLEAALAHLHHFDPSPAVLSLDETATLLLQLGPTDLPELRRARQALAAIAAEPAAVAARALLSETVARLDELIAGEAPDGAGTLADVCELMDGAAELLADPTAHATATTTSASGDYPDVLPAEMDRELLRDYLAEAREYIEAAETALLALERDPDDSEAVNTVFRAFHSIKGTSGFLHLSHVAEFAHHVESLLNRVREQELAFGGWCADLALRAADMMKSLLDAVESAAAGQPLTRPAGHAALLALLRQVDTSGGPGRATTFAQTIADSAPAPVSSEAAAVAGSMRVRTDRLDRLLDMVGELVIAQWMIAQDPSVVASPDQELAKKVVQAGKIVRELHDVSMSIRMVPLRGTFRKMARLLRDTAQRTGKEVALEVVGEDTEVDRTVVDLLSDPLVHMVRNAVDHGIETPDVRQAAGKPRAGRVRLVAYQAGGSVVVEVSDDGRGLDVGRIAERAVSRGLIDAPDALPESELFSLIFTPGFSTAERITDVSGRGVGMDVVQRNVQSLRGRVEIDSRSGAGCTFSLRVPLTLAVTDGMLVRIGSERYIIPTHNILLSFRPQRDALSTIARHGEVVVLRDALMPVIRLHRLFAVEGAVEDPAAALLVVVGIGERQCALLVDELLGQQQVVAKSLGQGIGLVKGVSGGAILGDGRVGLILDIAETVELARRGGDWDAHASRAARAVA